MNYSLKLSYFVSSRSGSRTEGQNGVKPREKRRQEGEQLKTPTTTTAQTIKSEDADDDKDVDISVTDDDDDTRRQDPAFPSPANHNHAPGYSLSRDWNSRQTLTRISQFLTPVRQQWVMDLSDTDHPADTKSHKLPTSAIPILPQRPANWKQA